MANQKQLDILKQGPDGWNEWRQKKWTGGTLDLRKSELTKANLTNADLTNADLTNADLSGAKLRYALGLNQNQINSIVFDVEDPPEIPGRLELPKIEEAAAGVELPHRIVTYSASVGAGVMVCSSFMSFRGRHNEMVPFELILDAFGQDALDELRPGSDEGEFRDFVQRALILMAQKDDLPNAEKIAAEALEVFEETMAGMTYSPLEGWSLEKLAKLKGGAAVGAIAWITGEPVSFLVCVAGGILVVKFVTPVADKSGKAVGNELKGAIQDFDPVKVWKKINKAWKTYKDD